MFEVGAKLDDMLEAAKHELYRAEGAMGSTEKAMQRVAQLSTTVDKDLDDGAFELETATAIKRYLAKAHAAMVDLSKESQNRRMMAQGMVLGMEKSVQAAKGLHDRELSKAGGDEDPGSGEPRRTGGHPKMSIKERRRAEDAEAAKKSNGAGTAKASPAKKKRAPTKRKAPKKKTSKKTSRG
jgi:hypothetical protein